MSGTPGFVAAALATALLLQPGAAWAKVQAVIVEWGEIQAVSGEKLGPDYQEQSLGEGRKLLASRYVNHRTEIAAQLCRRFGVTAWLAVGEAEAMPSRIIVRLHHPLLTRPDGVSSTSDSISLPVVAGAIGDAWTFDEPYEVQAGDWTFDLMLGGAVIASKTFTLTAPSPGDPPPDCPGRAVS